jgi:nucleoside-diphosphate-sugar epimerase
VVDARDLAAFALDLLERGAGGTYDVVSPAGMLTLGGVIDACREASTAESETVWVVEEFLLERGVEPWSEIPLWTPGHDFAGFQRSDVSRALAAGLQIRPIAETVTDTLRWTREHNSPRGDALTREREAELLAEWGSR